MQICYLAWYDVLKCRYTESLYALFSIGGVYYLMSGANNFPVLWLAVSGSARSNGVLNAGYYVFKALNQSYYAMYVKKHACVSPSSVLLILCSVLHELRCPIISNANGFSAGFAGSACCSIAMYLYFHPLSCFSSIWLLQYMSWT